MGIALGIPGSDITNGSFFCDGVDFYEHAEGNNSGWRLRHQSGYYFTSTTHDLYKQNNYKSKKFGYYYESTAALDRLHFPGAFGYKGGDLR